MPLGLIICCWLARDNRMLSNLFVIPLGCHFIDLVGAIGVTRIFLVQGSACKFAPVQARRLLRGVVSEADGDELLAVRRAKIKAVWRRLSAEGLLLQVHDCDDGFDHGGMHVRERILFFPRIFGTAAREVGHVEGGGMLRVRAAEDVDIGVVAELVRHFAADVGEIGYSAVVHKGVAAKDKGVAVDLSHDAAARGADMGKEAVGFGIGAEAAEVEVVHGWGLGLVEGWPGAFDIFDVVFGGLGVPGYPKTVHVQEAVTHLHEWVSRVLEVGFLAVGKQVGEIVLRALFGDGIGRVEEYIRE